MTSKATSVAEYLESLTPERRGEVEKVRGVVLQGLPKGIEETMQYGMISYVVPHAIYPAGYHCNPKDALPFAALASQKNYLSLYMTWLYTNPDLRAWFEEKSGAAGKKLDMGKSCLRFKKAEDLPLQLIGEAVARISVEEYIERYEASRKKGK